MLAAACSSLTDPGTGTRCSSGAATYSAYDFGVPLQATRSPTFNAFTCGPTAVTVPPPSWPGMNGSGILSLPSRNWPSIEFTPATETFTTASAGFGCGTGTSTSSITSGPPVRCTRIAFMVVPCGCGCSTVVTLLTYGFVGSANAIDGKYGCLRRCSGSQLVLIGDLTLQT